MRERGHIPGNERSPRRIPQTPRIPPEENVPKGCSLQSVEPLREWFSKGADTTSLAGQLVEDPPDICQYNTNIREE